MSAESAADGALRSARIAAAGLVAAPALLAVVAAVVRREPALTALTTPAVLAGLVAPALGFHLYRRMQEAGRGEPSRFVRATVLSLACTEVAATFGVVAYLLSREPLALVGVPMHALLAGAIWPSRARMESFLAGGGERG